MLTRKSDSLHFIILISKQWSHWDIALGYILVSNRLDGHKTVPSTQCNHTNSQETGKFEIGPKLGNVLVLRNLTK
jgi:hypothetical protein